MTTRKMIAVSAVAALAMSASSALAANYDPNLDVVVDLGTFTLEPDADGNPTPVSFTVAGPDNVVGFSFSGNASGISGNSTWASDTRLNISIEGDDVFNIGGLIGVDNDWDFQGGGSGEDGFYSSGPHIIAKDNPVPGGLMWTFDFIHDWNSTFAEPITWTDAQLTVHRVPAPGALALLGLAGLAGARRRRN